MGWCDRRRAEVCRAVRPSRAVDWRSAQRRVFAYADNYLIDIKFGIIMDVEASRAIRQSEVGASQTMIERTEKTFGIKPDWLVADTAYGAAHNLHFLVDVKGIAPHIPVIDKSQRDDGTFSRDDFIYDQARDQIYLPQRQDPAALKWSTRTTRR